MMKNKKITLFLYKGNQDLVDWEDLSELKENKEFFTELKKSVIDYIDNFKSFPYKGLSFVVNEEENTELVSIHDIYYSHNSIIIYFE
jgi:hypothetical protein